MGQRSSGKLESWNEGLSPKKEGSELTEDIPEQRRDWGGVMEQSWLKSGEKEFRPQVNPHSPQEEAV